MGTFNLENKVTYKELAPSLQQLIDSKATSTQYNECSTQLAKLTAQLGSTRISIVASLDSISTPLNNKEIAWLTANNLLYGYNNGWNPAGAVYS